VISKPYTLTLTLSLKGEGINGWARTRDFEMVRELQLNQLLNFYWTSTKKEIQ
jgi:hypothetical protein